MVKGGPHLGVCLWCIRKGLGGGNAQLLNGVREEAHPPAALGPIIAELAAVPKESGRQLPVNFSGSHQGETVIWEQGPRTE